jgi:hypothetical protein
MSRLRYEDLTPDDIQPYDHGRFNRASDEWIDAHPDRGETEADRAEWEKAKALFAKRWEHLFIQPGALSKRQAG